MQLLKVLARVLEYPTEELQQSKDALVAAVLEDSRLPRQNKEQLLTCIDRLCDGDLMDLQEAYVGTFDRGRATSLLLFEHVHGESRDRGQAMVDLLALYEQHGFHIEVRELPDFIPLYLEYLAHRPDLEAREGDFSREPLRENKRKKNSKTIEHDKIQSPEQERRNNKRHL